jgi:hypothetical protein
MSVSCGAYGVGTASYNACNHISVGDGKVTDTQNNNYDDRGYEHPIHRRRDFFRGHGAFTAGLNPEPPDQELIDARADALRNRHSSSGHTLMMVGMNTLFAAGMLIPGWDDGPDEALWIAFDAGEETAEATDVAITETVETGTAETAKTAAADSEHLVGPHGDMPSPRPGMESHHGVNSVWGRANIPGYDANEAPAVLLRQADHRATFGVFNRFRAEMASQQGVSVRNIDWTAVSQGQAWRLAEDQFSAAKVPGPVVDQYFGQWNSYLGGVG